MNNIDKKVVVITGASSGLGEATALNLAKKGAILVLSARRKERLDQLAARIIADGGQAIAVEADVTRKADVQNIIDKAIEAFGRVDVMVNNRHNLYQDPRRLAVSCCGC